MNKLTIRLVVGVFAFIVGIIIVWTTNVLEAPSPSNLHVASPLNESVGVASPDELNKLIIRFKGFDLYKDWVAKFEIINYTAQPIVYVGFRTKQEFDFCTVAAQQDERHEVTGADDHASGLLTRDHCQYAKSATLQTVEPGESVTFAVHKFEVQRLVKLDGDFKNVQIGFEFFVGDDKRREMFWSEYIVFPTI